jgi:hypothetical protein
MGPFVIGPLDVHCAIDDGFALCGGNKAPCVPYDRFVWIGEVLAAVAPLPRNRPWQRCAACVAMIEETT